jgi:class 3 adenylate cyclase
LFERVGDVRVGSDADKCLLLACFTLPFDIAFWLLADFYLGRPQLAPWADQDYLPVISTLAIAVSVIWLVLIGFCLRLRRLDQHAPWLVQATVFHWYAGTLYMIHCFGTSTSPVGLQMVGGALVGVLLFGLPAMAPGLITATAAFIGIIVAERMRWIPYAPLQVSPPFVDGQPAAVWFYIIMGLFLTISVGVFFVGASAIIRWRQREAEVTEMSDFLRRTFGRYLSPELIRALLSNPETVELGGQRREVTIMIADIRGFTQLTERLQPEDVVKLLNRYLCEMMDICEHYSGTVNDIVGDQLLVTFGAPHDVPDHARVAVACSIDMQNTMQKINDENVREGLPELEIGIGLNTAEVVVGNIGSERRSKFGVVGAGVNMASRIESYTVGGQILASEALVEAAGDSLRIDHRREVLPKGAQSPIMIFEIGGVGGPFNLALRSSGESLRVPLRSIELIYVMLGGKHVGSVIHDAKVHRISTKSAEIETRDPLNENDDLKLNLAHASPQLERLDFYAKVVRCDTIDRRRVRVSFTSLPPEISAYFEGLLPEG